MKLDEPYKSGDPDAARREDQARMRFFAINLVRLGGVFIVILGIMMMLLRLGWPRGEYARYGGFVLSVSGMFIYAILTRLLARRWATPRDGK